VLSIVCSVSVPLGWRLWPCGMLKFGLSRIAAACRRHGHDDDTFISPTTSITGHATVRDRIERAKGMTARHNPTNYLHHANRIDRAKGKTARQAIQPTIYTTRMLKRDETAGYSRLVRATGEGNPDTVMRDAEGDGLESDRSPM
jgi:hypothetical protein